MLGTLTALPLATSAGWCAVLALPAAGHVMSAELPLERFRAKIIAETQLPVIHNLVGYMPLHNTTLYKYSKLVIVAACARPQWSPLAHSHQYTASQWKERGLRAQPELCLG